MLQLLPHRVPTSFTLLFRTSREMPHARQNGAKVDDVSADE